jgi:hypothetical protein
MPEGRLEQLGSSVDDDPVTVDLDGVERSQIAAMPLRTRR